MDGVGVVQTTDLNLICRVSLSLVFFWLVPFKSPTYVPLYLACIGMVPLGNGDNQSTASAWYSWPHTKCSLPGTTSDV